MPTMMMREREIDHQFLQHNLTPAATAATFTGLSDVRKRGMRKKNGETFKTNIRKRIIGLYRVRCYCLIKAAIEMNYITSNNNNNNNKIKDKDKHCTSISVSSEIHRRQTNGYFEKS